MPESPATVSHSELDVRSRRLTVAQGGTLRTGKNSHLLCDVKNRRKGGRKPAEARMHLRRHPKRPQSATASASTSVSGTAGQLA